MDNRIGSRSYENLVREGIIAARGGRTKVARQLLERAARTNPRDARAWLWLSATTDDPVRQQDYLEKAVAADPANVAARKGLAMLQEKIDQDEAFSLQEAIHVGVDREPEAPAQPALREAGGTSFDCANCGGHMHFVPEREQLVCQYCGHATLPGSAPNADRAEQFMDPVLRSSQANAWAASAHRLACSQCGAVVMMPPGHRSGRCPYCGTNRMIQSAEVDELIDPHSIALFEINRKRAEELARAWLDQGFFAPDDLAGRAREVRLRPAYYSFWTFDGSLEVRWSCQVQEGFDEDSQNWVYRDGTAARFFDDVLVPGSAALSPKQIATIEPFDLKKIIDFDPQQLAGWPVLLYDRTLSDASLLARQKVMRAFRRSIHAEIAPGTQKKNIQVGAGQWSGLTFKHVLLPVWSGRYRYRGEAYQILVNGQTGKVGGSKPRDQIKVFGTWALILLAALAVGLIVVWLLGSYSAEIRSLFGS